MSKLVVSLRVSKKDIRQATTGPSNNPVSRALSRVLSKRFPSQEVDVYSDTTEISVNIRGRARSQKRLYNIPTERLTNIINRFEDRFENGRVRDIKPFRVKLSLYPN